MVNRKPKTHSDILWHFTGGPLWSKRQQLQLTRKKSVASAYEAFCAILKSRELRVGSYHELIKLRVPVSYEYDSKKEQFIKVKNKIRTIETSKVCCVADIPNSELFYHAIRYGQMAIGFKRTSLLKHGFNPVLYAPNDKAIVQNFFNAQNMLENVEDVSAVIDDLQSDIDSVLDDCKDLDTVDFSDAVAAANAAFEQSQEALQDLQEAMAFVKTFDRSEFDSIYSEREWRSVNNYNFKFTDVKNIILPRKGGYYDKFLRIAKSLGIPTSVELLAWEDIQSKN
ncbi:MAG: abortive infection system antitoxin AbiGi family protein [Candidatus Berkiella sp.]